VLLTYSKIKLGVLLYRVISSLQNRVEVRKGDGANLIYYLIIADNVEEGDDVWSST